MGSDRVHFLGTVFCHENGTTTCLLKPFFCIVTPSRSKGYNKIFIKKEKKNRFFCVPYKKAEVGGGQS